MATTNERANAHKYIWFPDGLAGKVPHQFHNVLEQLVYATWLHEQTAPLTTGAWCCAIASAKQLREVSMSISPLMFMYMSWEHIGPSQPIPTSIATGDVMCLFFWYPTSTLVCQLCYPKNKSKLYPTSEAWNRAVSRYRMQIPVTQESSNLPMVPTRRCQTCNKPARKRCICRMVYYCDANCQKQDRGKHKTDCDKILACSAIG